MRSIVTTITMCATFCAISGCFTVDSATVRSNGERHMLVENYGWFLFNTIPLACGNATENPALPWVLFRNDVTMDKVQRRFMNHAARLGRAPGDLSYHNTESVLFEIPGASIPIPIPYLLTYREIQLSGVLK